MKLRLGHVNAAIGRDAPREIRGRLFRKYVALFVAVVCAALVANGVFEIWFDVNEKKALLVRIQRQQAEAAALRISQFIKEIHGQLAWATQLPWSTENLEEWRFDVVRLLRQVPAITEVTQLDASGQAQAYMSRLAADTFGGHEDHAADPAFVGAVANKTYYGPVRFVRASEPYMTLAMAGIIREYGVILAEVNLKFIWDVVRDIKVGRTGRAFVVDPGGRLIAHPEINLVLRDTDMSNLAQVRAALAEPAPGSPSFAGADEPPPMVAEDIEGRQVLSVHANIDPLGWRVFIELPRSEAYASIYQSLWRSGDILLAALILSVLAGLYLARRLMTPIRGLQRGAALIGQGNLTHRIAIDTGDELEQLGHQFNAMADQLQDSYANLERKVEERTHQLALANQTLELVNRQLESANQAKSRFLANAAHDLRQPLHALGLFIGELPTVETAAAREHIVARIDTAIAIMNEQFKALLDISKLDAGALKPDIADLPVMKLFERIQNTFAGTAKERGLEFRVVPSTAWVSSDRLLLEQLLLNLVSNAVRYTSRGGVLVGCRRGAHHIRIEVWDTGPGIPEDQRKKIFEEFYRLGDHKNERKAGGFGLGLAIVDRLCRLLGHSLTLFSTIGRGSCFAVTVPQGAPRAQAAAAPAPAIAPLDRLTGKLIVVIDDDALILDATTGLLRNWGCRVVGAPSAADALAELDANDRPDLIVADAHLAGQTTGIDAIELLRGAFAGPIPAFVMSGDVSEQLQQDVQKRGYALLHKPVDPMRLRTTLNRLLGRRPAGAEKAQAGSLGRP